MHMKIGGAVLVMVACGGFGFSMAAAHRQEEQLLRLFLELLQFMYCELQFRMTPLPELCRQIQRRRYGILSCIFGRLAQELEAQIKPDASSCLTSAMADVTLPPRMQELLITLGQTLGSYHLEGQLEGIAQLRERCTQELHVLALGQEERLRSYQTLGLCAGAALAILFV